MDFRDPLFSVIMFFVIVLLSVLITIGLGKLREYLRENSIDFKFTQTPEDFIVDEILDFEPKGSGNFLILHIKKVR